MKKLKKSQVRDPIQSRSLQKKSEILKVAWSLFNKKSYDDISIRMIAEAASVSVGTIYSYFNDKREIFMEVAGLLSASMHKQFSGTIENDLRGTDSLEEGIYIIIQKFREIISTNLILQKEIIILSMRDKTMKDIFKDFEVNTARRISAIFLQQFANKINPKGKDLEAGIFVVHKALDEIVQYILFYNVGMDEERIFRETARMVTAYLEKDYS